jgi:hypothetical protein
MYGRQLTSVYQNIKRNIPMKKMSSAELKRKLGQYTAPKGLYQKTKDMDFLGKVTCNVEKLIAGS